MSKPVAYPPTNPFPSLESLKKTKASIAARINAISKQDDTSIAKVHGFILAIGVLAMGGGGFVMVHFGLNTPLIFVGGACLAALGLELSIVGIYFLTREQAVLKTKLTQIKVKSAQGMGGRVLMSPRAIPESPSRTFMSPRSNALRPSPFASPKPLSAEDTTSLRSRTTSPISNDTRTSIQPQPFLKLSGTLGTALKMSLKANNSDPAWLLISNFCGKSTFSEFLYANLVEEEFFEFLASHPEAIGVLLDREYQAASPDQHRKLRSALVGLAMDVSRGIMLITKHFFDKKNDAFLKQLSQGLLSDMFKCLKPGFENVFKCEAINLLKAIGSSNSCSNFVRSHAEHPNFRWVCKYPEAVLELIVLEDGSVDIEVLKLIVTKMEPDELSRFIKTFVLSFEMRSFAEFIQETDLFDFLCQYPEILGELLRDDKSEDQVKAKALIEITKGLKTKESITRFREAMGEELFLRLLEVETKTNGEENLNYLVATLLSPRSIQAARLSPIRE